MKIKQTNMTSKLINTINRRNNKCVECRVELVNAFDSLVTRSYSSTVITLLDVPGDYNIVRVIITFTY